MSPCPQGSWWAEPHSALSQGLAPRDEGANAAAELPAVVVTHSPPPAAPVATNHSPQHRRHSDCPPAAPLPRLRPRATFGAGTGAGRSLGKGLCGTDPRQAPEPPQPPQRRPAERQQPPAPGAQEPPPARPGGARCRPMAPCGPGDTADEPRTIGAMPARARVSPRSP